MQLTGIFFIKSFNSIFLVLESIDVLYLKTTEIKDC